MITLVTFKNGCFKNDQRWTNDNLDHEQGQEAQIGTVVGADLAKKSPEER